LSTNIFTKKVLRVVVENTTLRVNSMNQIEDLADYVRRTINEKDLTLRQVEERSGGAITHGYVSKILSRAVTNLSVDKLKALAKGLGMPEEEVFAVIRGKTTSGDLAFDELRMLELYRTLPPEKRLEAIAHLEVTCQFHAGAWEPHRHSAASTVGGSPKRSEKKRA
jgi:transcriptional regulator with XRE-family HTH domain